MHFLDNLFDFLTDTLWCADFFSQHRAVKLLCIALVIAAIALALFLIFS